MKINPFCIVLISFALSLSGELNARKSSAEIKVYATSIVKKNAEQPMQIGMVEIFGKAYEKLDCIIEFPED